ncbi:MAG: hypothetical protein BWK80_57410 [Desulfobacteraceae bacterium IS3]|nr:MAG: hypothetical protein BWK80_57410 [Desulfobacteraceae bacterium IS3]
MICGWILFLIASFGGVNPIEGSAISDYIKEPLGGIVLYFFMATALPAITVAIFLTHSLIYNFLNIGNEAVFSLTYCFIGFMSQAFLYILLGKIIVLFSKSEGKNQ